MKRKVLSVVLTLAMVVSMIPAMCITASAMTTQGWTKIGSCEYQITGTAPNKTLTIRPEGNGASGTLPDDYDQYDSWTWRSEKDNVSKVIITGKIKAGNSLAYMFCYFNKLTDIEGFSNLDTSNVENMYCMFNGCEEITNLDLSNFDTSNVTNMSCMIESCEALTNINLSSFDTSNVTNMACMFDQCHALTSLNLTGFDTSNVTDMSNMFAECYELTELNLTSFDTSKVTDMLQMFWGCSKLKTIYASDKFDVGNVTRSTGMFSGCTSLVGGEGTKYDSSKVDKTYARIDTKSNPGYFTKMSKIKQFFVKVNNNINRALLIVKNYIVKINKTFFNGKLNLSWLFS